MVSIKDIAKIAGVSPSTVSRVVNEVKYVKPEIRERVLAIVKQTGYVPNNAARSMVLKRSFTVGIVIPDTFNMFQRQLFSVIERSLEANGFHTLFFFVKWDRESELRSLRRIVSEKLDGLVLMHEVVQGEFYAFLEGGDLPVVLCTFDRPELGLRAVHIDEECAARKATEYLLGLGHRDIGLISGAHFSFGGQRAAGFRSALAAAGVEIDENLVIEAPSYSADEGLQGMRALLAKGKRPTALFAVTDELAIGAMRALFEAGLSVPGDVSVLGFDDIDISSYLTPGLSTMRQPIQEIGRRTAEIICALIEGKEADESASVFGFELVVRESCRRLD